MIDTVVYQDEIDEIIQLQIEDADQNLDEYRQTFQKIENRWIELKIDQKIFLVLALLGILSVGICSQIFAFVIGKIPQNAEIMKQVGS